LNADRDSQTVGTEVYHYHYLDMAETCIMGFLERLLLPEVFHGRGARKAKATVWTLGVCAVERKVF
jgi:hypothetical protein